MVDTASQTLEQQKVEGQSFWDANPCGGGWQSYEEFMAWYQRTEPEMFQILDPYDWTGLRVIEVGCGQGPTLNYLARNGAIVYGLDMSSRSLQKTKVGTVELGTTQLTHLVQADAERLPFPDGYFDMAVSLGVLHHTPDTTVGVNEIYRMLRPGGASIVMLYRSGNPKWWMTRMLREVSRLVDYVAGKHDTLLKSLQARQQEGDVSGTALMELFGVPILKAFSNRQARRLFGMFSKVRISNHLPGFRRLIDVLSILRSLESTLAFIDRCTESVWGFYQVIEARK